MKPKFPKPLLYISYWLFITIVIFACIEGIGRWKGYAISEQDERAQIFLKDGYDKFQTDEDLIWKLRQQWQGFEPNGVPVRTNALGFRGEDISQDPNTFRIYFLGDSVTYGHHLKEVDTIPVLLEQKLNTQSTRPIQVINGGVPGYSTFQEVIQFQQNVDAVNPELVLLGICLNDITERYSTIMSYGGTRFFMDGVDTTAGMSWWKKKWSFSATRHWLRQHIKKQSLKNEVEQIEVLWKEPGSEFVQKAWGNIENEFNDLIQETQKRNIPLAVVIYPHALQLGNNEKTRAPQDEIIQSFQKSNIPVLDLLALPPYQNQEQLWELFINSQIGPNQWHLDATHFSIKGSNVAAENIAAFIAKQNLVSTMD